MRLPNILILGFATLSCLGCGAANQTVGTSSSTAGTRVGLEGSASMSDDAKDESASSTTFVSMTTLPSTTTSSLPKADENKSIEDLLADLKRAGLECVSYEPTPVADRAIGEEDAIEHGDCQLGDGKLNALQMIIFGSEAERVEYLTTVRDLACPYAPGWNITGAFDGPWWISTIMQEVALGTGEETAEKIVSVTGGSVFSEKCPD